MIERKKIHGDSFQIRVPKKSAFTIDTHPDQLRLHQLMGICAQRGTGKGVILSSLLHGMKRQNVMDRIFILSPTIESNRPIFEQLDIAEEDEYHTADQANLEDIIKKCGEEKAEWDLHESNARAHKILQKILRNEKVKTEDIPEDLLLRAYEGDFIQEPPQSKYGHKPILGLIVDDFQGSNLFTASPKNNFINMCLRHRHIAKGLGLSIFVCCQTYSSPGGLPRVIRQNLTSLLLGSAKNLEAVNQIADEVGGQVDKETFHSVFQAATHNPDPGKPNHNFLLIDFHPKEVSKMFRRNLNEYLTVKK